jgi:hypothetical protein
MVVISHIHITDLAVTMHHTHMYINITYYSCYVASHIDKTWIKNS